MNPLDKELGILLGVKILAGVGAAAFGAVALLAVLDTSGRLYPLQGFLQNLALALVAMALGFLASYFEIRHRRLDSEGRR